MSSDASFYARIFQGYEPQLGVIREKLQSVNAQLLNSYTPLELIAMTSLVSIFGMSVYQFIFNHDEDLITRVKQTVFRLARNIPAIKRQIVEARDSSLKSIYATMAKSVHGHTFAKALPEKGLSKEELLEKLDTYRSFQSIHYESGKVSGCVYKVTKSETNEIYNKVFDLFGETNPLHADVFPDIRTMEAEVVRCVATMFHGDENVCGTMTSGGTESLLMACKTYRDLAYSKGITKPEM